MDTYEIQAIRKRTPTTRIVELQRITERNEVEPDLWLEGNPQIIGTRERLEEVLGGDLDVGVRVRLTDLSFELLESQEA